MRKVMITIAPTGGVARKAQNAHLPTQPDEIAEDVVRCHKAGAAIAAIHARRPDDAATCNGAIYRAINDRIRDKCDIILNNSTGGGADGDMLVERSDGLFEVNFDERLKGLDGGAEMATFDGMTVASTFNNRDLLMLTTPGQCDKLAERFKERGIKPEWEVLSPAHILQDMTRLIKKGYDKPPYYINIVLGMDKMFQGGMAYSSELLTGMVNMLPPDSIFCVSAVGPAQLPATTQAVLLGGHVRVGLEDNFYLSKGVLASNVAMVERQVRILGELDCEPATPTEAREMIGLHQFA